MKSIEGLTWLFWDCHAATTTKIIMEMLPPDIPVANINAQNLLVECCVGMIFSESLLLELSCKFVCVDVMGIPG